MLVLTVSIYLSSNACPAPWFPCRPNPLNLPPTAGIPTKLFLFSHTWWAALVRTGIPPKWLPPYHTQKAAPARTRAPHPHPHSDTCPGWGTALLTSTATAATADTLSQLQEELTLPIIKPTELQPFTTSTWVGGQPFPPALPPQLQVGLRARHNGTALSTRVPAAVVAQSQQVGECKSTQGTPLE